MGDWTFFSNHGHVLVCLSRDKEARLRDVAQQVGVTERAVQKIVRDLQDEGYLEVSKHGRRNRYRINNRKALRHSLQSGSTVGQLLTLLNKSDNARTERARTQPAEVEPPQAGRVIPVRPEAVPTGPKTSETRPRAVESPAEPPATAADPADEAAGPEPARPSGKGDKRPRRDLEQGQLF